MSAKRFIITLAASVLASAALTARTAEIVTLPTEAIATAVESAIKSRVGPRITVTVTDIVGVRVVGNPSVLIALPDPSARIGRPTRYLLVDATRERRPRVGEATATVRVVANVVRTSAAVTRGARLAQQDVAQQIVDLTGRPLRTLPSIEETVGARAKRDLPSGIVLTTSDIAPEPLVRAGQTVRAHARIDDVDVMAEVVAVEHGVKDAVIRVTNPETHRSIRARVIGKGEVEVVDVR